MPHPRPRLAFDAYCVCIARAASRQLALRVRGAESAPLYPMLACPQTDKKDRHRDWSTTMQDITASRRYARAAARSAPGYHTSLGPLLHRWKVEQLEDHHVCVSGLVFDHPTYADGTNVATSALSRVDGRRVFTRNSAYFLGQPLASEVPILLARTGQANMRVDKPLEGLELGCADQTPAPAPAYLM